MGRTLMVDLHGMFRSDREIAKTVRSALFRAAGQKLESVELIPGKGSGTLRRRVLAILEQPHLVKYYRRVETDPGNEGRILVYL
ncbi:MULTISPECIES: Smr/MutS family protein [Amycolatopsis]|uniref:Smr/MutS family protein n=1 Tax=Amycolatopsis albidoflavus TaxID=102226 RepID=A0ABW5HRP3_9PSEU